MAMVMDMDMEAEVLPPPLAIASVVVHEDTKGQAKEDGRREDTSSTAEEDADTSERCTGVDIRTGGKCGGRECKAKMAKPRKSEGQAGGEKEEEDDAIQDRGSFAALRSPSSSLSSRTPPSRLAASLLMGRDRMARAWREGARRAGIFGGEDDDSDEEETKRDEEGFFVARRSSVGQQRGSEEALEHETAPDGEDSPDHDQQDNVTPRSISIQPGITLRLLPSRLTPMTLLPYMAQLWMFLDRIECITIQDLMYDNEEDGAVHYILDVHLYQEQHNIPTQRQYRRTKTMATLAPTRKPAYQLQQRFSSFTKLRSRMLQAACRKHPIIPSTADSSCAGRTSHTRCAYCSRIESFLASGNESIARLGWKAKMFTTTETRKALLSDFITELVFLAREQRDHCSVLRTLSTYQQPPARHVLRSVPSTLKRFLTAQTGETFMR